MQDDTFWDPTRLARVEERRQALGTAECADEVLEIAGGTACFAGAGSWINQAAGLGLEGPVSEEEIERLIAFFTKRGVEPKVEVATPADPSLGELLGVRGFELREFEHVFARRLDPEEDLGAFLERAPTAGLTLEVLDQADPAATGAFARLMTGAFFESEEPPESLLVAAERVARHPRVTPVLARIEGEAAGGGQVELFQGAAALIGGAVLPRFRRRGIQQQLTVRRLQLARAAGASWACVHARPGIATERSALRFGFRLVYAKAILALPGEGLAPSP